MVPLDRLLGHFLIATLGWLLGMVVGIALGYGLAITSLRICPPSRQPRFVPIVTPWRTLIAGLVLLSLLPLPVFLLYKYQRDFARGLSMFGTPWEVTHVTFVVFLCAVALTAGIMRNSRAPVPPVLSLVSWARSLAVLAVVLATNVGFWTIDSGLGFVLAQGYNLMRFRESLSVIAWITGIALVIDLVLGLLEFLLASRMTARPAASALEGTS